MRHVIIDTDPGIDDALALMLALSSPELRVEAVTTVVGNVSQEKAHRNALKILDFLGVSDIPVARGASKPMRREASDSTSIHEGTGLGDAVLPEPKPRSDERSAIEVILEKVEALSKRLTLIAIGPLTNIASVILAEHGVVNKGVRLVIMGGAFNVTPYGHGNVTPVAEFNIWHDPDAAKIVFDSGMQVTAVGLDVTNNPANRLSKSRFEEIEKLGTRRSRLVADLCRGQVHRFNGLSLHDPLTIAAALDPSLVDKRRFIVDVETAGEVTLGQTVADRRDLHRIQSRREPNVDVCVSVDSERFFRLFMERVVHG